MKQEVNRSEIEQIVVEKLMEEDRENGITHKKASDIVEEPRFKKMVRNKLAEAKKEVPLKTTFDGRKVRDSGSVNERYKEFYPQLFNFESFPFYTSDTARWRSTDYRQNFVVSKNNPINQAKTFQALQEFMIESVSKQLQPVIQEIPDLIQKPNSKLWSQLLMQSPKLQKLFLDFKEQLDIIVQKEIKNNKDQIKMFMAHPRKEMGHLCKIFDYQ